MKNIRTLPRGKSSRLYFDVVTKKLLLQERLSLNATSFPIEKRNIYITSNEKIKIGDWFITADLLWKANQNIHLINPKRDKKIILTTDQDLIKDGVQAIDDEFLEWFVKNPSCEEVELANSLVRISSFDWRTDYKIIIPKEKVLLQSSIDGEVIWGEPKQETLEEAYLNKLIDDANKEFRLDRKLAKEVAMKFSKWQQERSYSEEEVLNFTQTMIMQYKFGNTNIEQMDSLKESLEQFKNK